MKSIRKIGLFGHYGNRNLGDEAIIQSTMQNIMKRLPEVSIVLFSINSEDSSSRHNKVSYRIRRKNRSAGTATTYQDGKSDNYPKRLNQVLFQKIMQKLKKVPLIKLVGKILRYALYKLRNFSAEILFIIKSYNRLKDIDILVVTGSNQFLDNFGGPWGFPYTLLKWTALAKLRRKKVYFVSVGAGPISNNLSKSFIRWTLNFADYASLRDFSSKRLIDKIGCKIETTVYPDLAHGMHIDHIVSGKVPYSMQNSDLPVVGINPMPLYDRRYWCDIDDDKYERYINKLVGFTTHLIDNEYPFYFFGTQEKDNNVIADILNSLLMKDKLNKSVESYVLNSSTVDELLANIATMDVIVATRFHGTVLPLLFDKPVLGICYYQKTKELLNDLGQNDYALDSDEFDVDELWSRFKKLMDNKDYEKIKIRNKIEIYRSLLDCQFDNLFGNNELRTAGSDLRILSRRTLEVE